jgi:hypothetical protein
MAFKKMSAPPLRARLRQTILIPAHGTKRCYHAKWINAKRKSENLKGAECEDCEQGKAGHRKPQDQHMPSAILYHTPASRRGYWSILMNAYSQSRLLTEKKAGDYLAAKGAMCARMLPILRKRGEGPAYYLIAGRALYDAADLNAWLEASRRVPSRAA